MLLSASILAQTDGRTFSFYRRQEQVRYVSASKCGKVALEPNLNTASHFLTPDSRTGIWFSMVSRRPLLFGLLPRACGHC